MINDLAAAVISTARQKGILIATAESCTGGMISAALTDIPGSSAVVDRGFVTYSNEAKQDMLGVKAKSLDRFGAVSESVAGEMAFGALSNSRAELTVSVTGIAGPGGGSADKPVGTVCFGIMAMGAAPSTETCIFEDKGRAYIRQQTVIKALTLLQDHLAAF